MDFLIPPEANTHTMSLFLSEVSSRHPGDFILMFMDRAGWHRSGDLLIPGNIKLEWLPPYSPQRNPLEHLRDEIREKWFANRVFKSLNAVEAVLCDALRSLDNNTPIVAGLTGFYWIVSLL